MRNTFVILVSLVVAFASSLAYIAIEMGSASQLWALAAGLFLAAGYTFWAVSLGWPTRLLFLGLVAGASIFAVGTAFLDWSVGTPVGSELSAGSLIQYLRLYRSEGALVGLIMPIVAVVAGFSLGNSMSRLALRVRS
ncbi:MAG: hypothetical protein ABI639_12325 [Thermoanaerobaculia bacterium]